MIGSFVRRNGGIGYFAISFFLIVVGFSLYYVRLADMDSVIILHFMAGRGADVLGSTGDALGMLLSGSLILVVNAILAASLARRAKALGSVVGMLTALITLLILIAILGIIAVN